MKSLEKDRAMKKLHQKMIKDKNLPFSTNLVFGEGSINAKIFFIGEAPGAKEDELIRLFVGRSGQLLDKMIGLIGLKREDVYISNIVKRRPPENRDPRPEEVLVYSPYLKKQIEIIDPVVIVTLGRFAMNYFIPEAKISRDQGRVFNLNNRLLIPMLHPAAALRGTTRLNEFKGAFLGLSKVIKNL